MVEGAPHTAKRSMINLCVYGVPPSPVYKGVEEGEGRPSTMARPREMPEFIRNHSDVQK